MAVRLPAEWEKHESTWLAWPHDKISFGSLNEPEGTTNDERLAAVENVYADIISALAGSERVNLLVSPMQNQTPALERVSLLKNVRIIMADYQDVWTRDYAPSFVHDSGNLKAIKWEYDAYSRKFPELLKDNEIFEKLLPDLGMHTVNPGVVLEGGAIEGNGNGILLTTEECLLKRNPLMSREDYEKIFAERLGIAKTVWLAKGLVGDHTDGHIDEVARFVSENTVLAAYEDKPSDPNHQILKDNFEKLSESFEVVKVPMPHVVYRNGEKAPASYVNFYIANKLILIPAFGDQNDEQAFKIISEQFPDRAAIAVDSSGMIYGGGTVHCATREQPAL